MKKLMLVLCCMTSVSVYAEGPYDGAWNTPTDAFASIYQKGNEILVLVLEKDLGSWHPLLGSITGNTATAQSVAGPQTLNVSVVFSSENLGTVTIISCAPASECDIPNGTQFDITRML